MFSDHMTEKFTMTGVGLFRKLQYFYHVKVCYLQIPHNAKSGLWRCYIQSTLQLATFTSKIESVQYNTAALAFVQDTWLIS